MVSTTTAAKNSRDRAPPTSAAELHEGDGEGVDEDVEHRPAADELDQAIEPGPLAVAPEGAALDHDQEIAEGDELPSGTITLAISTMRASGQEPVV